MSQMIQEVEEAFDSYQFSRASQALQRFAVADLSNFYMDVSKDRLYIAAPDDVARRRSCQTTMQLLLEGLAMAMSPLLPHMAEDIWQNLPYAKSTTSIFQAGWIPDQRRFPIFENEDWTSVLRLRDDVNKCMEAGRRDSVIGASLEAAVYIYCPDADLRKVLDGLVGDATFQHPPQKSNNVDDLRFLLLASQVHLVDSEAEVTKNCDAALCQVKDTVSGAVVGIKRATGSKCSRCWYYGELSPPEAELPHICPRCTAAVKAQGGLPAKQASVVGK
jgi:isoleucyl-tRNA synthetase